MAATDDQENYPPRPRWLGWLIIVGMAAVVYGLLFIGWRLMQA